MKKIVLIACSSKKLPFDAKARNLYISPLFKLNLKFAKSLKPDKMFILSAEHGLLSLDKRIEPYDKTLNDMPTKEVKRWARKVIRQLGRVANFRKDQITLLAGERYRRYLIPNFTNYMVPLEGLGIGKQLEYLKKKTSK